jgi:flagellar FliL protein
MSRLLSTLLTCFMFVLFPVSAVVAADDEEAAVKTPGYVSLGKPMVLNLSTDSRRLTFLQLAADVLVKDDEAKAVVEAHIPAIRHKLVLMLSEQPVLDMKSASKREEVRKQVTVAVREMINEMADNNDVEEVLFSTFLVQ